VLAASLAVSVTNSFLLSGGSFWHLGGLLVVLFAFTFPLLLLYASPIAVAAIWIARRTQISSPAYFAAIGFIVPIPFVLWLLGLDSPARDGSPIPALRLLLGMESPTYEPRPEAFRRTDVQWRLIMGHWLLIGAFAGLVYWWFAERPLRASPSRRGAS
jgi:hypothetical protein